MNETFIGYRKRENKVSIESSIFQVKKFLEKIEMNVLTDILSELFIQSGIRTEYIKGKHIDIQVVSDLKRNASAWHDRGCIYINAVKFDFNSDYKKDCRRILSAYVHEYVHALATSNDGEVSTGFKWISQDGKNRMSLSMKGSPS